MDWGGDGHDTGALPCPPVAPGVGWGLLAGGPGDTPPATAGMEGEGEGVGGKKKPKKAGGKEKRVSPSAAILSGLNFTLLLKI